MKKIIFFLTPLMMLAMMPSCSDMLDVDEPRSIDGSIDIDKKTDSLFYAWGIMQAMQQAADIYVVQNEVRGDLLTPTALASSYLKQMANHSATAANKYDSAYVYYKVVNNCNNYLANRDTTLYDGAYNVTLDEYAAVLSFRAWAYLQLARNYGKVKFFTTPLTSISQIDGDNSPLMDIKQIVAELSPELEKFAQLGIDVPNYANINAGRTNTGTAKTIESRRLFIPVDIMLGEMYLESGDYLKAARHYYDYLYRHEMLADRERSFSPLWLTEETTLPADFPTRLSSTWASSLTRLTGSSTVHNVIITYIPMAVNRLMGVTTEIPQLFGYDYYATSTADRNVEAQLVPSASYNTLADSSDYYYVPSTDALGVSRSSAKIGDQRRWERLASVSVGDSVRLHTTFYRNGNIVLYRTSTIWLHLAEALNRAGYPDAAFAILKDGINTDLAADTTYISDATKELFRSTIPFFTTGAEVFNPTVTVHNNGIHGYGCSDNNGINGIRSLYQLNDIAGKKIAELQQTLGIQPTGTKADTINAVEDLLCDEYAMELAFEGYRYSDLVRMARHKNEAGIYGSGFGGRWLANKLVGNKPQKDLTVEDNWYLPLK